MADSNDPENLSATFWPDGPVEIFDLEDINGMPVISTPYNTSVASLEEADQFLRESRFERAESWWHDESSEYYVAKVEFLGWDESPADDGAATAKLIELATPDPHGVREMQAPMRSPVDGSPATELTQSAELE